MHSKKSLLLLIYPLYLYPILHNLTCTKEIPI